MNFTNEQMTKAKTAKSAEELLAIAKESGIEMTEDEAAKYFAELNKQGELADDELASVAGGDKGEETPEPKYKKDDRVELDIRKLAGSGAGPYTGTIVSVGPYKGGQWTYAVQYDGKDYTLNEKEDYLMPLTTW